MRSGPSVEYAILGPLEARVDGRRVPLGGARQRAVLVCLLVRPNTVVPATRIVDEVWPDDPPATATNLVQGYVSNLRKTLGRAAIETEGAGYRIRVESLDLLEFERLYRHRRARTRGRTRSTRRAERSAPRSPLARAGARRPRRTSTSSSRLSRGSRSSGLLARQRLLEAELACGRARTRPSAEAASLVQRAPAARAPARAADARALRAAAGRWRRSRSIARGATCSSPSSGSSRARSFASSSGRSCSQDPCTRRVQAVSSARPHGPTIVVGAFDVEAVDELLAATAPLARDAAAEVVVALTVAERRGPR